MAAEKLLPQNVEAELGVLGSLMIDPAAYDEVVTIVKPADFYREAHRTIAQAYYDLRAAGDEADLITVTDELTRRGQIEQVGGVSYVSSLANQVPTSANADYYARIVFRCALMRGLIHAAGQIAAVAYNEPDAEAAMEQADKLLFNLGMRLRGRQEVERLGALVESVVDDIGTIQDKRASGQSLGIATGLTDMDKMTGGLQRSDLIILAARPSQGKCLTAHTLIDDPLTGERLTIEEYVRAKRPAVYGLSPEGAVRSTPISDWIDSGVKPVWRVRTRLGREVEVTGHHPFLTVNGWTPLHELHVGDRIAVPARLPVFGTDASWPLGLVRLLAYYIAEGSLTRNVPGFTNTDPVLVEDFTAIIAEHFPACAVRRDAISYYACQPRSAYDTTGRGAIMPPNPVATWLRSLGLMGKRAEDKVFPACVWTWPREHLAEFLRVLMSCDGSIYATRGHPCIEFTVASRQLAMDVQHALLRFGVVGTVRQQTATSWRCTVAHGPMIARYQREIGWLGEKVARFARWLPGIKPSNAGHVPQEAWTQLRKAAARAGMPLIELARRSGETTRAGKYGGYNSHTGRDITATRLARYAQVLGDQQLARLSSSDIYWDTILEVEPLGEQQVYDLTVPDGANFVAQDVCVHNTALALSMAYNNCLKFGSKALFFSLEMSGKQVALRLLAMQSGVDMQRLRLAYLNEDEWGLVSAASGQLAPADLYIDDTPALSITELRSRARRAVQQYGVEVIYVDYLQLMAGGGASGEYRRQENRQQEVAEISRGLKALARELDVPVVALSQLSRAVEARAEKVPQLSDLRESGGLEQDADIVMFIYRDEVYDPETERPNIADIIVAKHRNGPIGTFSLFFKKEQGRYRDLAMVTMGGPNAYAAPAGDDYDN